MYAALMFKGVHRDGTNCYAVERRQMGCFNGLNTTSAFLAEQSHPDLFIKMPLGNSGNPQLFQHAPLDFPRMSEMALLGIGWFTDLNGSVAEIRQIANRYDYDYQLLDMLNMERCSETYQSISGGSRRTNRELTANEVEISQVLKRVANLSSSSNWYLDQNSIFNKNIVAGIFALNNHCYGALMDWVGSERSSGMAVAYLQVFRNASRAAFSHSPSSTNVKLS